ncbi:unnamed protein product, partial [Bubo scandiacus]
YWEGISLFVQLLLGLMENLMCLHNFEMPQIKIYFRMMSLMYGLTIGSGLENSRSVFEVIKKNPNSLKSC